MAYQNSGLRKQQQPGCMFLGWLLAIPKAFEDVFGKSPTNICLKHRKSIAHSPAFIPSHRTVSPEEWVFLLWQRCGRNPRAEIRVEYLYSPTPLWCVEGSSWDWPTTSTSPILAQASRTPVYSVITFRHSNNSISQLSYGL